MGWDVPLGGETSGMGARRATSAERTWLRAIAPVGETLSTGARRRAQAAAPSRAISPYLAGGRHR